MGSNGFFALPFIMIFIFVAILIIIAVFAIIKIVKRIKNHRSLVDTIIDTTDPNSIASIFKKNFKNQAAKLDSETAKYKKVTCPYCGAINKGSDTKCSSCSAPLSEK